VSPKPSGPSATPPSEARPSAPPRQVQPAPPVAAPPRPAPPTVQERARIEPQQSQPARAPATAPGPRTVSPEALPSFLRPSTPPPRTVAAARSDPRPADTSPRSQRVIDWLIEYLPPQYHARALNYLVLMRLDRPVGALLLLWPTWWALWFASNDFPPPGLLVIFTLGVFVMRSAGCVINDYADHEWLDAHVERTRGRPMAAGRVTRHEALLLFGALLVLAFVLVLFTNKLTIGLSFVGAALAAVYPFAKRVTHLAQVVLGAAFGWSIPMAFAAVTNSLPPLCWLLFLANVLFSTIYDTEYAMVDRDDDIRVGAKSTAILFGDADRVIIGILMTTFLFAMLLAGTRVALHWPYFVGIAIAAGLLAWQQWMIRDRSRAHCFAAFRNNNWVGLALWVGLVLALAIR
jgi:4-hydroxybenzoate polyprenyltransferase